MLQKLSSFTIAGVLLGVSCLGSAAVFLLEPTEQSSPGSGKSVLSDVESSSWVQEVALDPVLLSDSTEITHDFRFQNTTGRALVLKKPNVSCGCSRVSLDVLQLAPGDFATLSVSVKLSKGYEGLKQINSTVSAESGQVWRFWLSIPVVSQLVVPPRIALRPQEISANTDVLAADEFRVKVRARRQEELSRHSLQFSPPGPDLRLTILGQTESVVNSAGTDFVCREYSVRLDLLSPAIRSSSIDWQIGELTGVILVDVIAPPLVTLDPARVILRDSKTDTIKISLNFPSDQFTARLSRCPEFLSPTTQAGELSSESPSVEFSLNHDKVARPVEEVVFQILQNGRPLMETRAVVISLASIKKGD